MRRALLALVLALAALGAAAAAPARAAEHGDRSWTVAGISQELMCPICKTRLDMSSSPAADQIRAFLWRAKRAGWTRQRVERELVASFGRSVLADTPTRGFGLLAWLLPVAVLAAGAAVATFTIRRWAAARPGPATIAELAAGPAGRERLERRLDDELARFDG